MEIRRRATLLLQKLIAIGADEKSTSDLVQTTQFTNILSITFGALSVPYTLIMFYFDFYFQSLLLATYFIGMLFVPYLNHRRHSKTATLTLVVLTNTLIFNFCIMFGYKTNVHHHLLLMIIAPSLLFSKKSFSANAAFLLSIAIPICGLFAFEATSLPGVLSLPPLGLSIVRYGAIFTVATGILLLLSHARHIFNLYAQSLRSSQKENQMFRDALEQSAVVAFTDLQGYITHVNDQICHLSGYTKNELIGKNFRALKSGVHPKEFYENLWKTITSGKPWRGEICNRSKGGEKYWMDATIIPCFSDTGSIERYFSIRFDITQKKLAEEMLVHSAKMASLGEMAGGVAHEINTPLAVNRLLVDQILHELNEDLLDTEKIQQQALKIGQTTDRIAMIIRGLRNFSRNGENDERETICVSQIIEDAVNLCNQKLQSHGVHFTISLPKNEVYIACRAVELSQVILNLLNNSFDAIIGLPEKWIQLTVDDSAESLKIILTDSGQGISPEVAQKIFQPFYTTKEVGQGTGLGLSISSKIIQSHGGRLMLDSSCVNTRFVIELPKPAQGPSATTKETKLAS